MELLKISIETHFRMNDGNIYFQCDGFSIGKPNTKPKVKEKEKVNMFQSNHTHNNLKKTYIPIVLKWTAKLKN